MAAAATVGASITSRPGGSVGGESILSPNSHLYGGRSRSQTPPPSSSLFPNAKRRIQGEAKPGATVTHMSAGNKGYILRNRSAQGRLDRWNPINPRTPADHPQSIAWPMLCLLTLLLARFRPGPAPPSFSAETANLLTCAAIPSVFRCPFDRQLRCFSIYFRLFFHSGPQKTNITCN